MASQMERLLERIEQGYVRLRVVTLGSTNATYVVFKNNIYQGGANRKCGAYCPITDFISGRTGNAWTNNRWDSGEAVSPSN